MKRRAYWQEGLLAVLAVAFAMVSMGCSDDLYSKCELSDELGCSGDEVNSCLDNANFGCQTRTCAKYQDSQGAFCSQQCSADGDCPGGECRQVVLGNDNKYCIPSDRL